MEPNLPNWFIAFSTQRVIHKLLWVFLLLVVQSTINTPVSYSVTFLLPYQLYVPTLLIYLLYWLTDCVGFKALQTNQTKPTWPTYPTYFPDPPELPSHLSETEMSKVHRTAYTRLDFLAVALHDVKTLFGINGGPLEMAFHSPAQPQTITMESNV